MPLDVCFWHKADILRVRFNVRFCGVKRTRTALQPLPIRHGDCRGRLCATRPATR
jgi:hypothetical protein